MLGSWGSASTRGTGDPLPIHPHPCTSVPSLGGHPAPGLPFRSRVKQENGRALRFAAAPPGFPARPEALPWLCLPAVPDGASAAEQHRAAPPVLSSGPGARRRKPATPLKAPPAPCTTDSPPEVLLRGYPPPGATGRGPRAPHAAGMCPSFSRCRCRGRGFPILQTGDKRLRAAGACAVVMRVRLIRLTSCVCDRKGVGL